MRYNPGDLITIYDIDTLHYEYGLILTPPENKSPLIQYTILIQKYPQRIITLPETQIHPYYMRDILNVDLDEQRSSSR